MATSLIESIGIDFPLEVQYEHQAPHRCDLFNGCGASEAGGWSVYWLPVVVVGWWVVVVGGEHPPEVYSKKQKCRCENAKQRFNSLPEPGKITVSHATVDPLSDPPRGTADAENKLQVCLVSALQNETGNGTTIS